MRRMAGACARITSVSFFAHEKGPQSRAPWRGDFEANVLIGPQTLLNLKVLVENAFLGLHGITEGHLIGDIQGAMEHPVVDAAAFDPEDIHDIAVPGIDFHQRQSTSVDIRLYRVIAFSPDASMT